MLETGGISNKNGRLNTCYARKAIQIIWKLTGLSIVQKWRVLFELPPTALEWILYKTPHHQMLFHMGLKLTRKSVAFEEF